MTIYQYHKCHRNKSYWTLGKSFNSVMLNADGKDEEWTRIDFVRDEDLIMPLEQQGYHSMRKVLSSRYGVVYLLDMSTFRDDQSLEDFESI